MKIGVINYEAGNLKSVETALRFLGADFIVSDNPGELSGCDKLIFPGVGEASSAMGVLKKKRLDTFLRAQHLEGLPVLGICLGCQIVLDSSDENSTRCLGLIPGKSVQFVRKEGMKVPHMGWNQVKIVKSHYLFEGIPDNSSFYFVHSYYPLVRNSGDVLGVTGYGVELHRHSQTEVCLPYRFHPEKSGEAGLKLLMNFIKYR